MATYKIKEGNTKTGEPLRLVYSGINGTYAVHVLKTSYQHGRDFTRWVYCKKDMSKDEAEHYFRKRNAA